MRSRELCLAAAIWLAMATALLVLESHVRHDRTDRLLQALDGYDQAQADLQRDLVGLRAGLLRNYDPLVADTDRLLASAQRLRSAAEGAPGLDGVTARMARAAARQAELAERLKSDNALLQNSLAHFSRISAPAPHGRPAPPAVSALSAALLRLALNTAPENRDEVARRLEALERWRPAATDEAPDVLLAHARLLHRLLPQTDAALAQVLAEDPADLQQALRRRLTAERAHEDVVARRWRIALTVVSATLVMLLMRLGFRLRAHVGRLRRRAQLEHLVAEISAALIRAAPDEVVGVARASLGRVARLLGAERAFVHGSGADDLDQMWSRPDAEGHADTPRRLDAFVRSHLPDKGAFLFSETDPVCPELTALLRTEGVRALALAWTGTEDGVLLLGFDASAALLLQSEELDVLRLALDAIGGALRRARLERAHAELERRLQAAGRMEAIGAFASGIAHNFNNILAAINGYAEMAAGRTRAGTDLARHVGEIRTAVSRARNLVDRILVFGRRRTAPPRAVAIDALIAESVSLLRAGHEGARIVVDDEAVALGPVQGDPAELQQVLLNLGANAIQASRGRGEIRFGAQAVCVSAPRVLAGGELTPGEYVRLHVADEGPGVPPKVLARIFEPFFTTREEGHGLGLATAAEIVRDHGGAISVISAPGSGAQFQVYLPRTTERLPEPAATGKGLLLLAPGADELLAVEDLAAALGYEPIGFTCLATAAEALAAAPPRFDGALVCHPDGTATLAAARRLRQVSAALPLVLSAAPAGDLDAQAVRLGCCMAVRWPPTSRSMAAALRQALARSA